MSVAESRRITGFSVPETEPHCNGRCCGGAFSVSDCHFREFPVPRGDLFKASFGVQIGLGDRESLAFLLNGARAPQVRAEKFAHPDLGRPVHHEVVATAGRTFRQEEYNWKITKRGLKQWLGLPLSRNFTIRSDLGSPRWPLRHEINREQNRREL